MSVYKKITDLRGKVVRAAEWMDTKYPGWYKRVKRSSLNLKSPVFCVLGQASGNQHEWSKAPAVHRIAFCVDSTDYTPDQSSHALKLLPLWKEQIRIRRD